MNETRDARRAIPLTGGENVRDLGGYSTPSGDMTRWGRFVRAGDMHELTDADQARLIDYGIGTVIDLRMDWECAEKPNVFAGSDRVVFQRHDFWGDRFDDYRSPDRSAPPERKLADLYCAGLRESGFVVADIMATFADGGDGAFIFHCRSGKDRTGLVSALLLAIAGVEDPVICDDFALTSAYLKSEAVNPIDARKPGAWQRGCAPDTMARTLAFVRETYGDAAGYLRHVGVPDATIGRLRERLLDR